MLSKDDVLINLDDLLINLDDLLISFTPTWIPSMFGWDTVLITASSTASRTLSEWSLRWGTTYVHTTGNRTSAPPPLASDA